MNENSGSFRPLLRVVANSVGDFDPFRVGKNDRKSVFRNQAGVFLRTIKGRLLAHDGGKKAKEMRKSRERERERFKGKRHLGASPKSRCHDGNR